MLPSKESVFKKKSFYVFLGGLLLVVITGSFFAYFKLSENKSSSTPDKSVEETSSLTEVHDSPKSVENQGKSVGGEQLPSSEPPSQFTSKGTESGKKIERERTVKLNDFNAAAELIKSAKNVLIITGAGISVAAGVPDFRSPNGFFNRIKSKYPDVKGPEDFFRVSYFQNNPVPFYKECASILGGEETQPTTAHRFIKWLEDRGQLALNVTQNIDTLELKAGVKKFVTAHGSFASSHCLECKKHYTQEEFIEAVRAKNGEVVKCDACNGIVKPDIIFYDEKLPLEYFSKVTEVADSVDLVIIMGTSFLVSPVNRIPRQYIRDSVPTILINMEPITSAQYDIFLKGDCQVSVQQIMDAIDK